MSYPEAHAIAKPGMGRKERITVVKEGMGGIYLEADTVWEKPTIQVDGALDTPL